MSCGGGSSAGQPLKRSGPSAIRAPWEEALYGLALDSPAALGGPGWLASPIRQMAAKKMSTKREKRTRRDPPVAGRGAAARCRALQVPRTLPARQCWQGARSPSDAFFCRAPRGLRTRHSTIPRGPRSPFRREAEYRLRRIRWASTAMRSEPPPRPRSLRPLAGTATRPVLMRRRRPTPPGARQPPSVRQLPRITSPTNAAKMMDAAGKGCPPPLLPSS